MIEPSLYHRDQERERERELGGKRTGKKDEGRGEVKRGKRERGREGKKSLGPSIQYVLTERSFTDQTFFCFDPDTRSFCHPNRAVGQKPTVQYIVLEDF